MAIYTASCGEGVECGNIFCSMWRMGEVWQSILQLVKCGNLYWRRSEVWQSILQHVEKGWHVEKG